jgi:hypothetical protein
MRLIVGFIYGALQFVAVALVVGVVWAAYVYGGR